MLNLTPEGINALTTENGRKIIGKQGFRGFCLAYLRHKFTLDPADFHSEMLDIIENKNDFIAILGFRGCAKSTIVELYALYALVTSKSKFTVYLGSTDDKAKTAVRNIKNELEENILIQKDFNLNLEKSRYSVNDKWGEGQITINGSTIIAKSRGSKIRGSKYKDSRIELIIGDDLEDTENTKSSEIRRSTREWFFTEVLQATSQGELGKNVKIILIGNLVHRDCLLAHLENMKLDNNNIIEVLKYPLLDENGNITWKGLYPDMEAIERQKQKVMLAGEGLGNIIWAREYLLKYVDEEDAVLKKEDIQYYPDEWLQRQTVGAGVGVDFAISEKQTADYTAMVKAIEVNNDAGERRLLIMKNNLCKRMDFENTIKASVEINEIMPVGNKFYPEKVAYQQAAIEIMEKNGLRCVPMSSVTDKKSRLIAACFYVKTGRVLFPKDGAEDLINNIIGFGIEAHDDYADAFVNVVMGMVKKSGGLLLG